MIIAGIIGVLALSALIGLILAPLFLTAQQVEVIQDYNELAKEAFELREENAGLKSRIEQEERLNAIYRDLLGARPRRKDRD